VSDECCVGPWNLDVLREPPDCTWGERDGPVRSLFYAGEPYQGNPTRVFAYYAAPENAAGPVPAMVLVHGGGGKAFPEWARMWAERGYAALAMDLGGCGADGQRLPDAGPGQDEEPKFHTIAAGIEDTWPYHAVAAVVRGASLLAAQPEVDAGRIGVTGISWGGYLTCVVAGVDERLKFAVPVYGCGFLHHNSAWVPVFEKMPSADRDLWLATFEPSLYLPRAHMPILWASGTNDFAYPLDSYRLSYRLPPGPRTLCVTVGMEHGHEPGWAPVEIGLFADHHLRGRAPLPEIGAMQRDGDEVRADFASPTEITEAGFHWTADTRAWPEREWSSRDAEVGEGVVSATLPAERPLVCYLTITDERGATVSTEHIELD